LASTELCRVGGCLEACGGGGVDVARRRGAAHRAAVVEDSSATTKVARRRPEPLQVRRRPAAAGDPLQVQSKRCRHQRTIDVILNVNVNQFLVWLK